MALPLSNLDAIRIKVRRLTRTPNISQMADVTLDDYINTFILYDFPENLRLFSLRTLFTFWTIPNVDEYKTTFTDPTDPFFNFRNKYISIHPPVYMAGVQSFYTELRDVFYGFYPQTNSIIDTLLRGDGSAGPFIGTTPHFILQHSVSFSTLDTSNNSMVLVDYPVNRELGALGRPNEPQVLPSPYGQINYLNGDYTVIFPNVTKLLEPITFEAILYQPGKPLAALFYDEKFTIRPVPDKSYKVTFEAFIRPTELLAANEEPYLSQWWQYIAFGTAVKILFDRMDTESVNLLMPEFKHQEMLVQRSTLMQATNNRTQTIYTQGKTYGWGGWWSSGWPY